jgi:hypothetical protein
VKLSEGIIKTPNADRYARLKCEPVDFSDKFKDGVVITEDMLRKVATAYAQSGIDEPSISIKASFQDMNKIKGNENLATFNSIDLCDIVTVIIEKLDIDVKAKVVSYTYNVLKERAENVEIGETRTNLTKQITAESKEQADRIIKTATFSEKLEASLKQRIADATAAITGNSGGYVVLYPPENPQEIFVMDTPDTKTAKNVWRWNKAGLGHSSNGVNGPFNVAIQQDGTIIADFIGAGELDGMLIKAGTVKAESLSVEYKQSVTTEAQELADQAESNANSATDDKLKNYSTTTEMQSALTVEAGKISAEVSKTYETKENATQKMTDANNALESYKREANAAIELNADAIKSRVTADEVTSQIEQSAESIRCQAKKISWKSDSSEMTEDGKLTCNDVKINGGDINLIQIGNLPSISVYDKKKKQGFTIHKSNIYGFNDEETNTITVTNNRIGSIALRGSSTGDGSECSLYNHSLSLDGAPNSGQYTNISATALYCTGSKHRVVRTQDYGERLLCCYETPSPMFGDVGAAQTDETGKCLIFIDEKFAQTIDLEYLYDVFLTKYGPGDCYVSERTPSYFVVKGTKNLKFAWEVKTIQRDYENLRLEAHTREKDDTDYIYDVSAYMNTLLYQLD